MQVALGVVLLTCAAPALAAAAGDPASGVPPANVRLMLSVNGPAPFPAGLVEAAIREADTIWAPHGVAVGLRGRTSHEWDADPIIALSIVFTKKTDDATTRWTSPLGGVTFSPDGVPNPVIFVFNQPLVRLATAPGVLNSRNFQWPAALRDAVIARVLGRVLAHEIGHFILRSRTHSAAGLMRSRQSIEDLVSPDRRQLGLSPLDVEQLQAVFDGMRPPVADNSPVSMGNVARVGNRD
jgi:hypothetical protein